MARYKVTNNKVGFDCPKDQKHVWLVLAGSGMRLYAFLGALRAAVEAGFTFRGVTCTSGGAVVGGALGKHWDPTDPLGSIDKLIADAATIDPGSILKKSFRWRVWEWLLTKLWRKGPRGALHSKRLLKEFQKRMPPTIGDCALPVQITAFQVNLKSPRPVLFTKPDTDLPQAVMASMTLPIFDPTPYGKALLEDGGWVRQLPIPSDQPVVLALYFDDVGDNNDSFEIVEDPSQLVEMKDNIDRMVQIVNGVLETNMRDSINAAEASGVQVTKVILKTSLSSLDFFATKEQRHKAIEEGYLSAKEALGVV